jgi:serine/threonine protein kinase
MNKSKFDNVFNEFKKSDKNIEFIGKVLGEGGFGEVRDMKYKGKLCAGKITEKKFQNSLAEKIKGPNIIKIYDILEKKYDGKDYSLIIMEKALLRDLGAMINHLHQHNFIKLINNPFLELIGNNLLKYFVKQIVQGMETLDKNELVHFDIKPENILIQSGLVLKVTDFSFLMNLQDNENEKSIKIPGGTKGYVTPEYYQKKEIDKLTAKKQDYFALGATIYLLKVGYQMLKYKKYENDTLTEDRIIDLLQRDVAHIRADPLMDKDFVDFLCQLIQYIPEERPSFEEIYRNKWLNKDLDEISFIINSFIEGEESVLMKELIKSDYLIKKQAEIKKEENRKNFTFID